MLPLQQNFSLFCNESRLHNLTRTINEKLTFFKVISLAFSTLIPVSCCLVEGPLKLLFWDGVKLHYHINFYVLHVLKSYCWYEFFRKQEKVTQRYGESCTCIILCFTKKYWELVLTPRKSLDISTFTLY